MSSFFDSITFPDGSPVFESRNDNINVFGITMKMLHFCIIFYLYFLFLVFIWGFISNSPLLISGIVVMIPIFIADYFRPSKKLYKLLIISCGFMSISIYLLFLPDDTSKISHYLVFGLFLYLRWLRVKHLITYYPHKEKYFWNR